MLTPSSTPSNSCGLFTCDQAVPFQCTISVPAWSLPAAHTSDAETALTPSREPGMLVTDAWACAGRAAAVKCAGQRQTGHRGHRNRTCPQHSPPARP
jgi:hypothetical protein